MGCSGSGLELEDTSMINFGGFGLGIEDAVIEHIPHFYTFHLGLPSFLGIALRARAWTTSSRFNSFYCATPTQSIPHT